jgi:ribonuclease BN (tRNA processing enzyme)
VIGLSGLAAAPACAHERPCSAAPLAVEVLGSGGPILDDDRASSAYLIWRDGRARVLVDFGGGAALRFAEAGARVEDLELVALSHLHVDHSGDLPALVKSGFFSDRSEPLAILGPDGGGAFPSLDAYLDDSFGEAGAYAYLSWVLDEGRGGWSFAPRILDHQSREGAEVFAGEGLRVEAMGVTHGPVPALAYRVEVDGATVVFSGDQNGDDPEFVDFARGARLLVFHHAVGEHPDPVAAKLHARPSEIGRIAGQAGVETLVLSHHMARSLAELETSLQTIDGEFTGQVEVAADHSCYRLD